MDHQALIRWLKECYREDHTRAGIRDFSARSLENRLMVKGEDKLACGFLDEDVLSPAYAEKLLLNLSLHQREKEYLYGCLFFTGKIGGKTYRAPLILYPAEAKVYESATSVSLDLNLYRINYSLLDVLDNKQEIEQGIMKAMLDSGGLLTSMGVSEIADVFRNHMPEVKVESLIDWPQVTGSSGLKAVDDGGFKLIPTAGWGVVRRSRGSSGVVEELENLGELNQTEWSSALGALFDGGKMTTLKYKPALAPVLLSENQEHLLKSARSNDLTVCHGPPGTGKSFTLAAIAIDHIARGQTVLVVSKKDHAADVLYDKIRELLDSKVAIVRAGRSDFLRNLKDRVSMLLANKHKAVAEGKYVLHEVGLRILDVLSNIMDENDQLSDEYEKSISRGEVSSKPNPRWYERIRKIWYEREVRNRPLLLNLASHLDKLHQIKEATIRELIRAQQTYQVNIVMTDVSGRGDMKKLLTGLKKRKSSEQLKSFSSANFDSILKVFPVWITSLSDLHRVLPPKREMFDVVIIDEASQCDIASALPAIQRAKRVVIAGDAKQLRHVAFIANSSMNKFARDLNLTESVREKHNYRNVSLMDLAIENTNNASQVALLNEHFRSLKPIIAFSNSEFYQDQLLLMRDRPWEDTSCLPLSFKYCNGERGEDGVNELEVRAVLEDLKWIMESEELEKNKIEPLKTIGILSPFRAQVDALTEAVNEFAQKNAYTYRLNKHQLRIGTAHSFQGEERDLMLISMALGKSDNAGARRFLEQEDVFNVSITRAKHRQIIYHSVQPQDLPVTSLLGKYISLSGKVVSFRNRGFQNQEMDDFAKQFCEACSLRKIDCSINESVASIPVDILLKKDGRYLGVDLVGYPGYTQSAVGINRHQILERAGMKLVPVGYIEWQVRGDNVLDEIEKLLNDA